VRHLRVALAKRASECEDHLMTKFLFALIALLSIGAGVANAASHDSFNFLEGGGG
jgi:hypothetical protein